MTRVVEIFLAIDCVVMAALFYVFWRDQRGWDLEPNPEPDEQIWLAQEGGSCRPAQLSTAEANAEAVTLTERNLAPVASAVPWGRHRGVAHA